MTGIGISMTALEALLGPETAEEQAKRREKGARRNSTAPKKPTIQNVGGAFRPATERCPHCGASIVRECFGEHLRRHDSRSSNIFGE